MRRIYTLIPFIFIFFIGRGQDIHFTQYNLAPVTLNPALTGAFYGSFRIGALYRSQFFNVDNFTAFKTPNLYIDAPIIKGFRDKDWVGVGANIFQDEAGDLELTFGSFLGSVAYHFALDKEGDAILTLGVQGGTMSRRLVNEGAKKLIDDETLPSENDNRNFFDLNAGLMLRTPLGEMSLLEVGVAGFHLTGPDYNLRQNTAELPLRYDFHARVKNYITETFTVTPSVLYKGMGTANQIALQGMVGFQVDQEKMIDLNMGLGYRINDLDALEILFGLDWGDFKAGFGYDLALTSLAGGSNSRPGAVEFAASYIAKIYKKPDPKPTLFCPRF
ncbi:MAG: PorP/SprF family type IX secretion system membrane protein [Saprospiraceae bacterium]|nr:PorP/SprF family type IX secretion system membrane protein [Saprospiraceae bacterium]